ncbi:MAG: hypothetical protein HYX46_14710 [Betaproteobacteria bacterium]|nr:hypothetical protein [Betaproteobacteria bacterium]
MLTVTYEEISSAFEFVASGAAMEHSAYISLDTGHIYWASELASLDEELPDDLDTSDRYLVVPHKTELDLGKNLALRFAARELPDSYKQVANIFRSKGAYGRFKQLLEDNGVLQNWYKFEAEASDKALREWCAENDIQIVEGSAPPAA